MKSNFLILDSMHVRLWGLWACKLKLNKSSTRSTSSQVWSDVNFVVKICAILSRLWRINKRILDQIACWWRPVQKNWRVHGYWRWHAWRKWWIDYVFWSFWNVGQIDLGTLSWYWQLWRSNRKNLFPTLWCCWKL